jgi:hypothetical protein
LLVAVDGDVMDFPLLQAVATITMASRNPTVPERLKIFTPLCPRATDLMDRQIGKCEPAPPFVRDASLRGSSP